MLAFAVLAWPAQAAVPVLDTEVIIGRPRPRVAEIGYTEPEVFNPITDRNYQGGYRYGGPPVEIPQEVRYLTAIGRVTAMKRIIACTDAWYYPFAHTAPKNEPPGIDIEILAAITKKHGWEYSILWANTGVYRGGLAGDAVFALHEDAEGTVWVGTADGLSRVRGGVVETFLAPEAFARDQVFSILEDEVGGLWVSNNRGVFRFPAGSLAAADHTSQGPFGRLSFGVGDGMPSRQCNGTTQPAALRARDGRLWYPTANGVAIADPELLRPSAPPPPVVFQRALVDGAVVPLSGGVVVRPGARRLEIAFAAPDLSAAGRLAYRHRLVGFDDGWSVTRRRFADFTSLPPVRYGFEVLAVGDAGLESTRAARVEVRVLPRLSQTLGFRVGAVLAAVLLAYSVHLLRIRRMAAQERLLNRLSTEKTGALAEANTRLEELSLSDALTGIANRRHFDRRLEEEWRRCRRFGLPLAEVLLDVDLFKAYNDALGHPAGDECLRRVAGALSDRLRRAGDLVARYGGEEFVALLPGLSLADAYVAAEHLRTRVEALRIPHPSGKDAIVTVSAGVASVVPGHGPASRLTSAADAALYEAKRRGRNQSVAAGRERSEEVAADRPDTPSGRG